MVDIILAVSCVLACVVGVIALVVISLRKTKKVQVKQTQILKNLQKNYQGHKESDNTVGFQQGEYDFTVTHVTGKHAKFVLHLKSPADGYPERFTPIGEGALHAPVDCAYLPSIDFTRESGWTRLGKSLRISRELQTGDAPFDDKVFIHSTAPDEIVHQILRESSVRRAILFLLDCGYSRVALFTPAVPVYCWSGTPVNGAEDGEIWKKQCAALTDIARALPALKIKNTRPITMTRASSIMGLSILWAIVFFFIAAFTSDTWQTFTGAPINQGLLVGVVLWMVSLPVLVLLSRGFSDSLGSLLGSTIALLVALPTTSMFLHSSLNAWLDHSKPREVHAKLVDSWVSKGSKSTSYYMRVDPGKKMGPVTDISISSSFYYRLRGKKVTLIVKDGAFGWKWIEDYHHFGKKKSTVKFILDDLLGR